MKLDPSLNAQDDILREIVLRLKRGKRGKWAKISFDITLF